MSSQLRDLHEIFVLFDEVSQEDIDFDWAAMVGEAHDSFEGYGHLYQLPYGVVAAGLFKALGVWDTLVEASKSDDPQAGVLELTSREISLGDVVPELEPAIPYLMLVTMRNLMALSLFHLAMPELIEKTASGDDDAMFKAVLIDPSCMQTDAISSRISTAVFHDDRSFFDRLAKALTKTKPARPKEHLDNARLLMTVLEDAGELSEMTDAEITRWAVDMLHSAPSLGRRLDDVARA